MFKRIPPHIFWPGMVVAFLGFTLVSQMILLMAARSGEGLQVEEDYYDQSLIWEEKQALKAHSQDLGWRVELSFPDELGSSGSVVEISIVDKANAPVEGLEGTLTLRRPSRAGTLSTHKLTRSPDKPGVYRSEAPISGAGLWDFTIETQRDGRPWFKAELRKDLGPPS